ncbi:hypothetical protein RS130_13555 [Paraglaciecola aquimarina]|uniref:Uncharacterized protein n=1 Tax=Paraglaciecola aquimarina TaxID=1235557 RepID=A0ABU3SY08_9ALTE|nr:hypothetical protein [Paraglaciecola aquimarina]MDU0354807.1 hypothetical protein [Paraglaciecola aquimarina]
MSKDGYVLHLKNFATEENNTARQFFEALIKGNRSKLKAYRDEEEVLVIGEALRNIYANNIVNTAFFLHKDGGSIAPDAGATSPIGNRVKNLLQFKSEEDECNLYPLFRNGVIKHNFISHTLSNIKPSHKPVAQDLFIAFDPSKEKMGDAVHSLYEQQFTQPVQKREFIAKALQHGQFIAVKIFIARTGRPDFDTMQSELNYVSIYALHKAKILEEKLWNVTAVGDIIDVTDEVLKRYNFEQKIIEQNHQAPKSYKISQVGIEQLLKA